MDITVNTDFAQVEADDQVVNLSRFSLFFPEKRRFFLERSSIMDFGFESNNRLFYSRRIGINEGRINPLWGGVRLVGRVNKYDVGFLTMQSRGIEGAPSENFGVIRLRRKVSDNNSYIGGILTTRTDLKGAVNLAYGLDGIINLFGNDYLKVNFAGTYDMHDNALCMSSSGLLALSCQAIMKVSQKYKFSIYHFARYYLYILLGHRVLFFYSTMSNSQDINYFCSCPFRRSFQSCVGHF